MNSFILRRSSLKQRCQGRFLEYAHTQNLEKIVERSVAVELFFEDGDHGIDADGHPQLGAHGVVAGAVKGFDAQMLLEPAEEQFDLPALFVELANGPGGQPKMIGQEYKHSAMRRVVEAHPPQFVRIIFGGIEGLQGDGLVAAQTAGPVTG